MTEQEKHKLTELLCDAFQEHEDNGYAVTNPYDLAKACTEVVVSLFSERENKQWIPVTSETLPEVDEDVLCYYKINSSTELGKVYEYKVVGHLHEVLYRNGAHYFTTWHDTEGNIITPSHYRPLPSSPSISNTNPNGLDNR